MIWVLVVIDLRFWVVTVDISVGSWCCGWTWVRGAVGLGIEICGVVDLSLIFLGLRRPGIEFNFSGSWD